MTLSTRFRLALALLLSGTCFASAASAQAWQWVRAASGPGSDDARAVAVDAQSNVYVAGQFLGATITFGSTTLTNAGMSQDMFLAKYSSAGTLLWVQRIGGTGADYARGVAVDAQGNVLFAGTTGSAVLAVGSQSANSVGPMLGFDAVVAKFNPGGTCLWAQRIGGNNDDDPTAVAADGAGNVYVSGYFASATLFLNTVSVVKTMPNAGSSTDAFVAKYNASGAVQWVRGAGGTSDDRARDVAVDAAGNVTLTGFYGANGMTIGGTAFASTGANDLFVARYSAAGALAWVKQAGSTANDEGASLALDTQGNTYMCGSSVGPAITFGGTATLSRTGFVNDGVLVRYNAAGVEQQARKVPGSSGSTKALALDAAGGIYLGAPVGGTSFTFAGSSQPTGGGSASIAVFQVDRNWADGWARYAGINYGEYNNDLAIGPNGVVYVVGAFEGPTTTIGGTTLTNSSGSSTTTGDIFVAALSSTVTSTRGAGAAPGFALSPNPSRGKVRLNYDSSRPATIRVYNALGRLVLQADNADPELDLSSLSRGLYYVQAQLGGQVVTHKQVLE